MKMLTSITEIDAFLKTSVQRMEKAIIRQMFIAGEECNNVARSRHTYKDQTGNLTSSIGYVVAVDGKIINPIGGFDTVLGGQKGAKEGKAYAKQLVSEYNKGIVLIVVAGMDYAKYVSDRGYDVLDSAELEAKRIVPILLSQLKLDNKTNNNG